MDIKQLRYFIAIAEEKNITAAANRLHMSQPPLSIQLKQLEEELGVHLVERTGKTLTLTDKGNLLYKHALHLVNSLEEVKSELRETAEGRRGRLSIGINTLSVPHFSEWINVFHQRFPNVSLRIVQNDSLHLTEQVRSRDIELAFVRLPLEHLGLHYEHLSSEPFIFVHSQPQETITLEEISELPLILPSTKGLGSYSIILEAFSKRDLKPDIIGECSDMLVLLDMVARGIGATILPRSILGPIQRKNLFIAEISNGGMNSSYGFIELEQHHLSGAATQFLSVVKECVKS